MNILAERSTFNISLMRAANFLNINSNILYDNKEIFNEFYRLKPDIFIGYANNVNESWLRLFNKFDTKVYLISDKEINLDINNLNLIHQTDSIPNKNSIYLPFASDTLLYKPGKVVDTLICDVVYDNPRKEYIEYVCYLIKKAHFRMFGDTDSGRYGTFPQYLGFLTDELLCDVYRSSLFSLTFNNGNIIGPEYYKIWACGGLCLSLKNDLIQSKYGDLLVSFSDKDELLDKVSFIKNNHRIKKSIVVKSLQFAQENSYIERVKQLLS